MDRKQIRTPIRRRPPEFGDLILACRHRLLTTIILSLSVAGCFAITVWTIVQPKYVAESFVRVREQQSVIFAAQTSRSEDTAFFRTQAKLARSPQVISAAIERPDVAKFVADVPEGMRVKWLEERLQAETQPGSETMSISVEHRSNEAAQALCNAITESYLAEITHRLSHDRAQREHQLELAARAADADLDRSWDQLNHLAEGLGSDTSQSLTIRDEMQFQSYRDYSRRLQAVQLRGSQLQAELNEKLQSDELTPTSLAHAADESLNNSVEVLAARERLISVDLQIQQMRNIAANDDSPKLQHLRQQREYLAEDLNRIESKTRSEVEERIRTKGLSKYQQSLAQLKSEIELNRNEKTYLREQLSQFQIAATNTTSKTAVPLDMSRHEVARQSQLADRLWQSLQELRIEGQSQPRVTLIELASLPEIANHARKNKYAAIAALAGWVFVVFAVGCMEWYDCRVREADDVISHSKYPVFGAASYSALETHRTILQVGLGLLGIHPNTASDGAREAVARVVLRDQDSLDTISLMITSCLPSEPRHLVSQEIACLLASFQRSVLLIDCDTDRSQLNQSAGASSMVGIRQLPVGVPDHAYEAIAQLIVATKDDLVDFLPSGPVAGPSSWIEPRSLRSVISVMKDHYDVIIVNGPSFLASAESALLAAEVDRNLFATFFNMSRWDQLLRCEETAESAGITISGSVLHDGRGKSKLQLNPGKPKSRKKKDRIEVQVDESSSEIDLRRQISELQQEIRRVQTDQKTSSHAELPGHSKTQENIAERI
jgi:capsular polysaccharide biosynthesis protein/Mrp family chromosome partitioning ATPase